VLTILISSSESGRASSGNLHYSDCTFSFPFFNSSTRIIQYTSEQASAKADLSLKSNGFVMIHRPDCSHARIGMKPNGLCASATCTLLCVWGVFLREVAVGCTACHPSSRSRPCSTGKGETSYKPPALAVWYGDYRKSVRVSDFCFNIISISSLFTQATLFEEVAL